MEEITSIELQNLKQLIKYLDISYQKLNTYSANSVDTEIKQMFTKLAQDNLNAKQELLEILK